MSAELPPPVRRIVLDAEPTIVAPPPPPSNGDMPAASAPAPAFTGATRRRAARNGGYGVERMRIEGLTIA